MSTSFSVSGLVGRGRSQRNLVRQGWDWMSGVPGGRRVFSHLLGMAAPYSGSIGARIVELAHGHAVLALEDRRSVRNHIDCIHAVALVNLAELCGNAAVAYSLPDDARLIVAGLSIEYFKKARGRITATCDVDIGAGNARREVQVPVSLANSIGEEVARATLRTLIGPKKPE